MPSPLLAAVVCFHHDDDSTSRPGKYLPQSTDPAVMQTFDAESLPHVGCDNLLLSMLSSLYPCGCMWLSTSLP